MIIIKEGLLHSTVRTTTNREQCHESFRQNFYFPIVTTFCLSITTISVCSMNFLSSYSYTYTASWLNFICSLFLYSPSLNKGRFQAFIFLLYFILYSFFFCLIPELNNITFRSFFLVMSQIIARFILFFSHLKSNNHTPVNRQSKTKDMFDIIL